MENEEMEMIGRHSLAHVMAKAIMKLYPKTKLTIGPAIEDGFYYDLDTAESFTEDVLPKIEKEMKNIISHNEKFVRREVSKAEALEMFKDNEYKTELINELPENEVISVYYLGDDFVDLCRGPHVEGEMKRTKCFKEFMPMLSKTKNNSLTISTCWKKQKSVTTENLAENKNYFSLTKLLQEWRIGFQKASQFSTHL